MTYVKTFLTSGVANGAVYRSIAADFEPESPKFRPWAKNKLMDRIFREQNDLVVPTKGVYEQNGVPMFPIKADNRLDLAGVEDVHHGNYFANKKVVDKLRVWLSG